MTSMKAMRVGPAPLGLPLVPAERPLPEPKDGEVLIRVHAAGVTVTELLWYPTTHNRDGSPRDGAVPGHEFSGVVAAIGAGVSAVATGDAVYGMNDWFADGATAEFCLTRPEMIAPRPSRLSHEEATTVPIGALTAWQGLMQRADVKVGERVLIHGAAGSVGIFAVQLARMRGAHIIATASERNAALVKELGADEVIDYRKKPFEDQAGKVDMVFDGVGSKTRDRSWNVLKPGGRMVTIAADSEGVRRPARERRFSAGRSESRAVD